MRISINIKSNSRSKSKRLLQVTLVVITATVLLFSCSKKPTDFREFLHGEEVVYPGLIESPAVRPGDGRILLSWQPSPDPSIEKYTVFWNNHQDSVVVPATTHDPKDTIKCLISDLDEYDYTFFVVSYDSEGNKSIPSEIDHGKVYGDIYRTNLINRPVNLDTPFIWTENESAIELKFLLPDTINTTTWLTYTNTQDQRTQKQISADVSSIVLADYKSGTPVLYQSAYIPVHNAIDTFITSKPDTFPDIFKLVQCDKGLFREMHLPNGMGVYSGTALSQLWDGATAPKEYPNIFHSDGAQPLPQHFSFDLGRIYTQLSKVEESGRGSAHNPAEFEVWGIADTTGAITTAAGNDPGWAAEAASKGWTLLRDVVRTDETGIDPYSTNLMENPPPVRFIMIRVTKTVDNSDFVNISQFTFWDKQ